ncbi:MAG: dTDP-4-amino-4,6-dideoxygalactose transaminase [Rhizobiales bacterium]|nr:dTDP-4-amino-4,6-dideoxygalactose transaminase [Hyphomicrobiales bacterium]
MKIPFNRPVLAGPELDNIREAIARQRLAGDGAFTDQCQRWLTEFLGSKAVLLTHSCTAALEMASILAGIEAGDEVIMPSFTFVSTANAVALRGGVPVFVDIRRDTLNIDEALVERAITPRTKAITVVHYAGVPAEMTAIGDIAKRHGLLLIEDAAQALGSEYRGRRAGSIGDFAAFSFHETKNIISGEGGALALNNDAFIERAEIIREKGTNRKRYFRGEVDKYTWQDIGSSFLPGELIASFLYGQLVMAEEIQAERLAAWRRYDDALAPFAARGLGTPVIPDYCTANGHIYYLLMPSPAAQKDLIARMAGDGIVTPFHYVPLHSTVAGARFGRAPFPMPVTDDISARLVRLPLYPKVGQEIDAIIDRVSTHLRDLL